MSIEDKLKELQSLADEKSIDIAGEIDFIRQKMAGKDESAWGKVLLAREAERPSTLEYANLIFDEYLELHGDRYAGDDPAIVGGVALLDGEPVTFIGHQKGRNIRSNLERNFGTAHPEGYRKALRLAKQAEKFGRPVITFIDTPGAYCGVAAEERGIGEAIAMNLKEFSVLKTPILCFVTGEGGSGGALGIGVGDKLYMLENSIYSVISPEGFASILLRDATKAKDAALLMRLTAKDIESFGIIHGIIGEAAGGAHTNPKVSADLIKEQIKVDLRALKGKNPEHLIHYRTKKIREIGHFQEKSASRSQELFRIFKKAEENKI